MVVQLPEGIWYVNVEVTDSNWYYNSDSFQYYFPITKCNENLEYGADIPVRYIQEAKSSESAGNFRLLFSIYFKKRIKIKSKSFVISTITCDSYKNSDDKEKNWADLNYQNNSEIMNPGDCFLAFESDINIGGENAPGDFGKSKPYVVSNYNSLSNKSIKISGGCALHGGRLGEYWCGIYKCFKCFDKVKYEITYFDDSEVYDSWSN